MACSVKRLQPTTSRAARSFSAISSQRYACARPSLVPPVDGEAEGGAVVEWAERQMGWCRGGAGGEAEGDGALQAVGMGKAPEPPRTRLLRRLLQNAATAATLVGAATVLWGFTHPQGTDTTVAGDDLRS
jgi:hypothetical protein